MKNFKKYYTLSSPYIRFDENKYINEALKSEWVSTSGKFIDLFANELKKFTGSNYVIPCINGTSALHLMLKSIGIEKNDEVIVPTISFIAPINAIRYMDANPVFMDCDEFHNIDCEKVIEFVNSNTYFKSGSTYNKKTKRKIKAIIVVHVWGNAVNIYRLVNFLKKRNIILLEDSSESLGTFYKKGNLKNKHTGTIGLAGCLSFNSNKLITTGGGGAILTNNKKIADYSSYLSTQAKDDSIFFVHNDVGFNYRLPNINAALGYGQIKKLKKFLLIKKNITNFYKKYFKSLNFINLIDNPNFSISNNWFNVISIDQFSNKKLNKLIIDLEKKGIQTRPIWKLNHQQKKFKNFQSYKIEKALKYVKHCLCIPSSLHLNEGDIKFISFEIHKSIEKIR